MRIFATRETSCLTRNFLVHDLASTAYLNLIFTVLISYAPVGTVTLVPSDAGDSEFSGCSIRFVCQAARRLLGQREMDVAFLSRPFVEANDRAASIRSFFHRGDHHIVFLRAEERILSGQRSRMLRGGDSKQRIVQVVALANRHRLAPCSRVRIQRVGELVMPLVGVRVRPGGAAQQREAQNVVLGVVSVLAVVQQREAMRCVGDIAPAQRGHFELRFLRRRIAGRRTLDRSVRNLEGRLVSVNTQRESDFQQDVMLVPVGLHVHVDARHARIHRDVLR